MLKVVIVTLVSCLLIDSAWPQQLTPDQEKRVEIGINLIKLGCGTGSSNKKAEVTGTGDISLTLKKLPGVSTGGTVTYSTEEAQGLAIALQKEITSETAKFSEAQIDCMKPYIKRVFDLVLPDAAPPQNVTSVNPVALDNLTNDDSSSEKEFVISGGDSIFLTPRKVIFSAIGNPFAARGDLFGARLEGVQEIFSIGLPKEFRAGQSTCSITLLSILRPNTGRFYLRC